MRLPWLYNQTLSSPSRYLFIINISFYVCALQPIIILNFHLHFGRWLKNASPSSCTLAAAVCAQPEIVHLYILSWLHRTRLLIPVLMYHLRSLQECSQWVISILWVVKGFLSTRSLLSLLPHGFCSVCPSLSVHMINGSLCTTDSAAQHALELGSSFVYQAESQRVKALLVGLWTC